MNEVIYVLTFELHEMEGIWVRCAIWIFNEVVRVSKLRDRK